MKIIERRMKRDLFVRLLGAFNIFSWCMVIVLLILTERAKPQFETFFDRFYHLDIRTHWDLRSAEDILDFARIGVGLSTLGLCLSFVRARRKRDGNCLPHLILGVASILGIIGLELFVFQ